MENEDEVLVIRGRIDRFGRFQLRRCRSTRTVRQWPVVESSEYVVELIDGNGNVIHRELVEVTPEQMCEPGAARRFRLLAYIGLREEAVAVRIRHDDLVVWQDRIPEPAQVSVRLYGEPRRVNDYPLRLAYSPPGEGSHVTVVFQWGRGRFLPISIGPAEETIALDLTEVPGGEACRFVVTYSNGMRSAGAATEPFFLERRGPSLVIERPGQETIAGTPVIFEGHVHDPERPGGAQPDRRLRWLVDGEEVGRGPIASVDGLIEGGHQVTLAYEGEQGTVSTSTELLAVRSMVPTANEWDEWGDWTSV